MDVKGFGMCKIGFVLWIVFKDEIDVCIKKDFEVV